MKLYSFQRFDRSIAIPELADGFDPSLEANEKGMEPVTAWTEEVDAGIYEIHISITALCDIERLFVFTGRKQLREIISLKAGECFAGVYYQSVTDIIPRFHDREYSVKNLFFTICTEKTEDFRIDFSSCYAVPAPEIPRIFLCGDSTVTEHTGEIPYHPGACYAGWGQALPAFLMGDVAVENQAHCGLTTETFRMEGHFDIVRRNVRPGDICLIQFGHNDQKLTHLLPDHEYIPNLCRLVKELQAEGARCVLVSPLGRNIWTGNGEYLDLLGDYTAAVEKTAADLGIPWINLHGFSTALIRQFGLQKAKNYFHPGDYTHCNEYGAYHFACFAAWELGRIFPETIRDVKPMAGFTPPENLWENLHVGSYRPPSGSQKEAFDTMEKSTEALLRIIREAKEGRT